MDHKISADMQHVAPFHSLHGPYNAKQTVCQSLQNFVGGSFHWWSTGLVALASRPQIGRAGNRGGRLRGGGGGDRGSKAHRTSKFIK